MSTSKTLVRTTALTALVLATLSWGAGSQAAPAAAPTATLGAVTCTGENGRLDIAVTAGETATTFYGYASHPYAEGQDQDLELAAGESGTLSFGNLEDETYSLTVGYYDEETEDELVDTTFTVACDAAPVGPYTNARGFIDGGCSAEIVVLAANKPIGGNTADLQPVTFTLTYTPEEAVPGDEEPVEEPEEPGDDETDEPAGEEDPDEESPRTSALDPVELATFTLDATTPTYEKTFTPTEGTDFAGTFTLTAGDEVVAESYAGVCVAVPSSGEAAGGLPNTGA